MSYDDVPAGYRVVSMPNSDGPTFDPLAAIHDLPARISSGYRTPEHNRAVGGVPGSKHMDADAVDLVPEGTSMGELHGLASGIAAQWRVPGARAINEGDHVHLQLPRWGGAPGSPLATMDAPQAADEAPGFADVPRGYSVVPSQPAAVPTAQEQADAAALFGRAPPATAPRLGSPNGATNQPPRRYQEAPPALDPGFTAADRQRGLAVPSTPPLPSNESYRSHTDPAKVAQLQAAFDGGAGVEELQTAALNLGLDRLDVGKVREMVNYRNAGKSGARFQATDAHLPAQGPQPGETIPDYYKRLSGGATIDGPYTPEHPMGRNLRDEVKLFYKQTGIKDPDEAISDIESAPLNIVASPIAGSLLLSDAKHHVEAGHYGKGVYEGSLGAMGLIPFGPGGEIRAGTHVVDALALRVAASVGDEAPTIARAGEAVAGSVDDALRAGGTVTLHGLGEPRQIVGMNEAGELVDHTGATIHPEQLAGHIINPPKGSEPLLEVSIPEASARSPVPSQAAPDATARLGGADAVARFRNIEDMRASSDPERAAFGDYLSQQQFGHLSDVDRQTMEAAAARSGGIFARAAAGGAVNAGEHAAAPVPGEALASDLPQEAADEAARLGRGQQPPVEPPAPGGPLQPPRRPDYLDIPPGYSVVEMPGEQSALGFSGRMNEPRSAEEMAALARNAQPESFAPIPSSLVRTEAEAMRANPGTQRAIEPPALPGRAPAAPETFADTLKAKLKADSKAKGMPVRVDAEHAIDSGVSADLVYLNPNVADKTKLRLRYPSIFGTRYGKMTGAQQHLVSLDMDGFDPVAWGFDHKAGGRLDPEDVGDLLRRSLEGDPSAFQRGARFDAWTAHHEAEAQRAEFDGRFPNGPPVERTGTPATLQDIRANEPPATSYEDLLSSGRQRVANINLANIRTGNDVQRALEATEAHFGGFDAARRGTMSHAETQALASEMGMTVEDLLRRRQGQALNAEQSVAARTIHAKSLEEITAMAGSMEHWTPEEREQFAQHLLTHAKIYEQVTAATAEAGRALSAHRITADAKAFSAQIHRLTAATGRGKPNLEDVARYIVNMQKQGVGPGGISRFAVEAAKPATKTDMLLELFYNSILSAPSTHAINMLGNAGSMAMSVPEYGLASLIGKVRGGADRIHAAEVGAYVDGLTHGLGRGIEAFKSAIRTGEAGDASTKFDVVRHRAIPGLAGNVIRTPSRFLVAEDELFKSVARQGAVARLAARQAVREGLAGDKLAARVAELRANPSDAMMGQARDFARYMTFQREPGRLGKGIQNFTDDYPVFKFLIPFVRTQENLVKFAAERSPLGFIMPTVRAELKAGGARRDLALAKMAIGSTVGILAYQAARHGIITGGDPLDPGTRNLLHDAGWQPYSIKIGGRYVSFRRLDPLSLGISVAADLATYQDHLTPKERENGAAILAQLTSRNIASSFWMESVGNLFDLLKNPGKEAPNQIANIVGALAVPNIIAQPTASMDSRERSQAPDKEASLLFRTWQTILNRVKGRIPGLRQTLPAKVDAFGEPVRNDGRWGPDIISPFPQRLVNPDPTYQTLLDNGLRVDQPGATVKHVRLTPRQRADETRLSGRQIKEDLIALQQDPDWRGMSPEDRRAAFDKVKRAARSDARSQLGLDDLGSGYGDLPPGYSVAPQGGGSAAYSDLPPGYAVASPPPRKAKPPMLPARH